MKITTLIVLYFLVVSSVSGQPSIDTDIFIYEIDWDKRQLYNGKNITSWSGYDNQPFFNKNSKGLYFTRLFSDQSDAYYYDLDSESLQPFVETIESEYSPTLTPDGKYISTIRVEQDSSQRLWRFPVGNGNPELLLPTLEPVGYQAWIDNQHVALFVLGSPNTLQIGDISRGTSRVITNNIGRSLHHYKGSIFFVHKEEGSGWWIKRLDVANETITKVIETLPGREDFTVTTSGRILMGDGEDIYVERGGKWQKLFTVEGLGFSDFNRMVVSPDESKLALVVVMDK